MAPRIVAAILLFPPLALYDAWVMGRASRVAAIAILLFALLALGVQLLLISFVAVVMHQADIVPPWWPRTLVMLLATIALLLIGIEWICRRAARAGAGRSRAGAWLGTGAWVVVIGGTGAWFLKPVEFANVIAFRVPVLATLDSFTTDQFDYRTAGREGIRSAVVTLPAPSDTTSGDSTEILADCHIPIDASWQKEERQEQLLHFTLEGSGRIVFIAENPISDFAPGAMVPSHLERLTSEALADAHDLALMRSIYETTYENILAARNFDELVDAELRYLLKVTAPIPQPPVVAFEGEYLRGFFRVQPRLRHDLTQITAVVYDPSGSFRFRIIARRSDTGEESEAAAWITSILANIVCSP